MGDVVSGAVLAETQDELLSRLGDLRSRDRTLGGPPSDIDGRSGSRPGDYGNANPREGVRE
eukprot:11556228-Heterocapsa_arctica.AAC.1